MAKKKKSAYAEAGVDIDVMMNSLKRIGKKVKDTNTSGVVSELGSFGGLFKSPGKENLLVSSVDGVGTKLKVANTRCSVLQQRNRNTSHRSILKSSLLKVCRSNT